MDKEKFTNTRVVEDYEVWTDTGWETVSAVHETIPFTVWKIQTPSFFLECADEHKVFDETYQEVYVKNLRVGDRIITERGIEPITKITTSDEGAEPMYDLTIDHENHRFFSNGILSANTTLMTIYTLWLTCFFPDQTVGIVANKEQTAIGIFKRIRTAYELLPMYLKPGVKDYGKTGVTFDNDSCIIVSTTTATTIRGSSMNCVTGENKVVVRDKMSGAISSMEIKELAEILKEDNEELFYTIAEQNAAANILQRGDYNPSSEKTKDTKRARDTRRIHKRKTIKC